METNISDPDYCNWILQLKQKFQQTQIKAAVQVNQSLLKFYWELGADIVFKQAEKNWGSKFLENLSIDLQREFPEIKGFSLRNIKYIRQWFLFYNQVNKIGQQVVAQLGKEVILSDKKDVFDQHSDDQLPNRNSEQLFMIPWGHHIAIISKCKTIPEAHYYLSNTINQG